jgi:hypothetical protein
MDLLGLSRPEATVVAGYPARPATTMPPDASPRRPIWRSVWTDTALGVDRYGARCGPIRRSVWTEPAVRGHKVNAEWDCGF